MACIPPEFSLETLLEQLSEDELRRFKSLLKNLPLQGKLRMTPWSELEEANGKKLAEILIDKSPKYWIRSVTVNILEKMNLTQLSRRAKAQIPEGVPEQGIDAPKLGDTEENLDVEKPGKMGEHRNTVEKPRLVWNNKFWQGDGDYFLDDVTRRSQKFIPFLHPKTPTQPIPHTVVLHGPAGVGKTTLAKKLMLDWTETSPNQTSRYAFYLSCGELSRMGTCSFAELISKDQPTGQEDISKVLAQAQKILFIIDGFEELKVPEGTLIRDICGDWEQRKPVPVLLGSLLKRKMSPKAMLLVTTRSEAMRELRLLVEQPLLLEIEGFLEQDRKAYFLRHFEDEDGALRALDLVKSNAALFRMSAAPAVCRIICTCLKLQMESKQDPAPSCLTTTSLFLRFLCGQFMPAPGGSPSHHLRGPLRTLCLLAAQGTWTQTWVFDAEDLGSLGVQEADLRPFLDKGVLQQGRDCEGCYSFVHLSIQQLLAATFYILEREEEDDDDDWESHTRDIGDVQKLFSKEERLKNPNLIQVGYFLFGLSNEKRAQELEMTFGCRVSLKIREELLKYKANLDENKPFSDTDTKEFLYCLYESQDEGLVKDAMARFQEVSVRVTDPFEMMCSFFCLKHCQNLQKISLQVAEGVFLENDPASEPQSQLESKCSCLFFPSRVGCDRHSLRLWRDSSVGQLKQDLSSLDMMTPLVRILCDHITLSPVTCRKVVSKKNVTPDSAYRDFCLALIGKKTLTRLTLEGHVQCDEMLLTMLCEILRHKQCSLQHLRLGFLSVTTQQWADLSSALQINQSLTCLDLSANELLDEGVKVLHTTFKDPKCFLQRLSLEDCHLTEACCKTLASVLVVNQQLKYLCLAKNDLGNTGVKLLCKGLGYPDCKLETLVLQQCNINKRGCRHLSKLLQEHSSLRNLDLGLNPIAAGLWFLCEALKNPNCNLKFLGLWCCSIPPFSCQDLASALISNQKLETLDLSQNNLGNSGVTVLLEALKQKNGPLKTLRLKANDYDWKIQKLLEEIKEVNPRLAIEYNGARTTRLSCC
uniref:NLR family pyrin domain containing 7 n=1 Tax=Microcebus murinus TaxID=30608 RepID=A0A8C5YFN9_MICMU